MTDTYRKDPDAVSRLSAHQYYVTQENGTERPFDNVYHDNKDPGIYVDVVSGEPLFASTEKYDSGSVRPRHAVADVDLLVISCRFVATSPDNRGKQATLTSFSSHLEPADIAATVRSKSSSY